MQKLYGSSQFLPDALRIHHKHHVARQSMTRDLC